MSMHASWHPDYLRPPSIPAATPLAAPAMEAYLESIARREPPVFRRCREETLRLPLGRMQITPEQGQLLAVLLQISGARSALELGTFTGYASLWMAWALQDREGQLVSCERSEQWAAQARTWWAEANLEQHISLAVRPCMDLLDELLARGNAGTWDFAFVDADRRHYPQYYERLLELLRPGAMMVFNSVLWHGRVADPALEDADTAALRALNARIHDDERISFSLLPVGDGMSLIYKRRESLH